MSEELISLVGPFLMVLLQNILPLVTTVVVGYVLLVLNRANAWVQQRLGADAMADLQNYTRILVLAYEGSGMRDGLEKIGAQKKAEVLAKLQEYIAGNRWLRGITVDQLSHIIEATVLEELNRHKTYGPTAAYVIDDLPCGCEDDFDLRE